MEIFLTVKNVYGNNLVYPQCITSENLAKFKGVKTFKADDIKLLAKLGYNVTWVAQKLQGVA